jgi:hypothetical protein
MVSGVAWALSSFGSLTSFTPVNVAVRVYAVAMSPVLKCSTLMRNVAPTLAAKYRKMLPPGAALAAPVNSRLSSAAETLASMSPVVATSVI